MGKHLDPVETLPEAPPYRPSRNRLYKWKKNFCVVFGAYSLAVGGFDELRTWGCQHSTFLYDIFMRLGKMPW
ncbi:predicted protein [Histoplasma mississippiense (nom. inval.)]|uniref:predicted protein n=1 Tax=Ajellomyces capsulatus (strain NAm1 / WU24) TaxID=2059318 RepID=UPI000157B93A|nr:predicted protein [Histoplasma mississippiense (nom. inval.)]EDN03783.1 predicted protein [Histoplasma mississippiense (nom. inval.)]